MKSEKLQKIRVKKGVLWKCKKLLHVSITCKKNWETFTCWCEKISIKF